MKIGIIGVGVVGSAIKKGFEKLGFTVKLHDIKFNTSLKDILDTKIVYICLPTNSTPEGACDIDLVGKTVFELNNLKYKGIIAIKSTIIPGTFKFLETLFDKKRICHVPEFLREKYAYEDFTKRHNVLVIGAHNKKCINTVIKSHGKYPKNIHIVTPYEAEFVKYFSNTFKALKVLFANSFGTICNRSNIDYSKVLRAYELENIAETAYLGYSQELKGFGGMCLPKDLLAFSKLTEDTKVNLFNFIFEENKKFIDEY
jgi:UDPglucose 6-dehydrogenase